MTAAEAHPVPAADADETLAPVPGLPSDADTRLLRRFARGDSDALTGLYQRYHARLLRSAFRITRDWDDAEDVTADVWAKLLAHADRFHGNGNVAAWLSMIVRNQALDFLRRKKVLAENIPRFLLPAVPGPEAGVLARVEAERIVALAQQLPDRQRAILLASVEYGGQRAAADALGISPQTAKQHAAHARRNMQALLTAPKGTTLSQIASANRKAAQQARRERARRERGNAA